MLLGQLRSIDPSASEPLFRRLMTTESLSYLREDKSIIGFELDLTYEQVLAGFTLIAMQKHTIYVYRSDLHETPRLILFPSLDKLFDDEFELLNLRVIKTRFTNATFVGDVLETGIFKELVVDLTPPEKNIDIPEGVSAQMVQTMTDIRNGKLKQQVAVEQVSKDAHTERSEGFFSDGDTPFDSPEPSMDMSDGLNTFDGASPFDTPPSFDDYMEHGDYDTFDDYGSHNDVPEDVVPDEPSLPLEDPRTVELRAQTFETFMDVSDYVVLRLNVPRAIATQVSNGALQASPDPAVRLSIIVELFAKIFNDGRI